jgi:predicted aldo/keto reductase-like oxidoreductase
MKSDDKKINSGFDKLTTRRSFFKSAGIAGLGSIVGASIAKAADANIPDTNDTNKPKVPDVPPPPKPEKIPTRKLGKTGIEVPILSLGFGRPGEQVVLRQAMDWGVSYWDTSLFAANSEQRIGAFLGKNPELRKDIFLVTKETQSKTVEDLEKCLQTSLKNLNTSYIDLYFGVYMVNDMVRFTDDVKKWAEDAKKRGLIKYFGFTTHQNMPQCLMAASKLDWIDAIMTTYNFRLTQDAAMQEAVEACNKAGIGLIAMKTQGMRPRGGAGADPNEVEAEKKMLAHFTDKGFTAGQAKIKAVLDDKRISTVCSSMSSISMLMTNIAGVLDRVSLTAEDKTVLNRYAQATCSGYCAGCGQICEQAASNVPVSDIMRAMMYHNSYGDKAGAREVFAQIPAEIRSRLLSVDYSAAEARCPNRMAIGRIVADAAALFSQTSA